ncbi:hypothetical protein ACOME3_009688 [Neoechinorhynchus agilis]
MGRCSDITSIPGRQIVQSVSLEIQSRIVYIDFEAVSNDEIVKRLVRELRPRNLCIVHSSTESTDELAKFFSETFPENKVFTPDVGELVDFTQQRNMFQLTLNARLMAALRLKKAGRVGGGEESTTEYLAWISGDLTRKSCDDTEAIQNLVPDSKQQQMLMCPAPSNEYQLVPIKGRQDIGRKRMAIFVKEPRLSDLKTVLRAMGMKAEFYGGVLLCNDRVALRKLDAGRIVMEGPLSDIYFTIREVVYRSYAIL